MADPLVLGFVLTDSPAPPEPHRLVKAWKQLHQDEDGPELSAEKGDADASLTVSVGGSSAILMGMPIPVPGDEVEQMSAFSASLVFDYEPVGSHQAHLVLAFTPAPALGKLEQLEAFWELAAAVVAATEARGVSFGAGCVAHPAEYVLDAVEGGMPLTPLWCGVSIARVGDGERVSALTRGLQQLGLKEFEVVGSGEDLGSLLSRVLDLASYVADRGRDIPDGDTIGQDEDERLEVRYAPSPVDPSQTVCRVEL